LLWSSPAIDAGGDPNIFGFTDQRSFDRPLDGNLDGSKEFDIGSYEYEPLKIRVPDEVVPVWPTDHFPWPSSRGSLQDTQRTAIELLRMLQEDVDELRDAGQRRGRQD